MIALDENILNGIADETKKLGRKHTDAELLNILENNRRKLIERGFQDWPEEIRAFIDPKSLENISYDEEFLSRADVPYDRVDKHYTLLRAAASEYFLNNVAQPV